ncbi:MAG TPA: quinone-dependent dihydroorotate dehydrogenase [Verrucomicrobiae bacterium]|jgi:dihydroorotate dehydrogenase|nr:quinone-dependent dihydroorotate dehydrogenase [Verrucomicrobiae bacterium]
MAGWLYHNVIRPVLFRQQAEAIHDRTLRGLGVVSRHPALCRMTAAFYGAPELPVELFGLRFSNPIGLAAGMDKFARAICAWPALGFGFSELGGVTWHEQPGNPAPRLFRAISEEAVVNSMGFNNPGAEKMAQALAAWKACGRWPAHPVGINLGKSKITPLEKAAEDYAQSFRALRGYADFFVVNVSSPNTPNLRQLQDKSALNDILAALQEANAAPARPILVKVAPDLAFEALDEILDLAGPRRIAGIVATNTTITRPEAPDARVQHIYSRPGGLSGRPLRQRSTEVIRHLSRQAQGKIPIIGVGGIFDAADAWEKITAGASLLQLYTSLIYRGPGVNREIVRGLRSRLEARGLSRLEQAVGLAE